VTRYNACMQERMTGFAVWLDKYDAIFTFILVLLIVNFNDGSKSDP